MRGVARIISHFTEELMVLPQRLEEVAQALEDMMEWSEFKFVFKGATSKVVSGREVPGKNREMIRGYSHCPLFA